MGSNTFIAKPTSKYTLDEHKLNANQLKSKNERLSDKELEATKKYTGKDVTQANAVEESKKKAAKDIKETNDTHWGISEETGKLTTVHIKDKKKLENLKNPLTSLTSNILHAAEESDKVKVDVDVDFSKVEEAAAATKKKIKEVDDKYQISSKTKKTAKQIAKDARRAKEKATDIAASVKKPIETNIDNITKTKAIIDNKLYNLTSTGFKEAQKLSAMLDKLCDKMPKMQFMDEVGEKEELLNALQCIVKSGANDLLRQLLPNNCIDRLNEYSAIQTLAKACIKQGNFDAANELYKSVGKGKIPAPYSQFDNVLISMGKNKGAVVKSESHCPFRNDEYGNTPGYDASSGGYRAFAAAAGGENSEYGDGWDTVQSDPRYHLDQDDEYLREYRKACGLSSGQNVYTEERDSVTELAKTMGVDTKKYVQSTPVGNKPVYDLGKLGTIKAPSKENDIVRDKLLGKNLSKLFRAIPDKDELDAKKKKKRLGL